MVFVGSGAYESQGGGAEREELLTFLVALSREGFVAWPFDIFWPQRCRRLEMLHICADMTGNTARAGGANSKFHTPPLYFHIPQGSIVHDIFGGLFRGMVRKQGR